MSDGSDISSFATWEALHEDNIIPSEREAERTLVLWLFLLVGRGKTEVGSSFSFLAVGTVRCFFLGPLKSSERAWGGYLCDKLFVLPALLIVIRRISRTLLGSTVGCSRFEVAGHHEISVQ